VPAARDQASKGSSGSGSIVILSLVDEVID
jgi:hypothetical protein